jgi:hypothetical protein
METDASNTLDRLSPFRLGADRIVLVCQAQGRAAVAIRAVALKDLGCVVVSNEDCGGARVSRTQKKIVLRPDARKGLLPPRVYRRTTRRQRGA